jgi:ribosomal protein S18 acetylase RimI-like enzyme
MSPFALVKSSTEHIAQLQSWFKNQQEMYTWGAISCPMSSTEFVHHLRAYHLNSYSLSDKQQYLLAFGQHYLRLNRHHLGRLVVNPEHRGKGLAKLLINKLIDKAFEQQNAQGVSLFVFRDNLSAYKCYQSLGFVECDYPQTMPGNVQNCAYMILPERELSSETFTSSDPGF